MAKPILIRGARQLLTLHGPSGSRRGADLRNLAIIQDGSILISDGLIREVGATRRLENLSIARDAEEINATGKVILPGFVDPHTHLVSGPARLSDYEMRLAGATQAEIAKAGGGIPAISKAMLDVPVRTLEAQAWRVLREAVRQGTTTLEAKSGYGIHETGEVKIFRAHAALNLRLNNVVSTFLARFGGPASGPEADAYIDWLVREMLPQVKRRKLARFVDLSVEEGRFSVAQARRVLTQARQLGLAIKMHTGEFWNIGGVRLAVEMGAVSADHVIYIDHDDIVALAASNTVATLLPGPVFYLGLQRYSSARMLIDRGAAVALGTNYNPETCPTQNMQMIIALACRKMEMTPAEAISAATINAAHALGMADSIGSIEFGKQADLVMLSVPDYREIPYHFGVNLVEMTMKRGQVVYRAAEVKCLP